MKKTILAIAISTSMGANAMGPNETELHQCFDAPCPSMTGPIVHPMFVEEKKDTQVEDTLIGAGAATAAVAGTVAAAAPIAVAHSSGAMILYSGAGYVAGTIGVGAATVAALPVIAVGGAAVAVGAAAYKHRDAISNYGATVYNYWFE